MILEGIAMLSNFGNPFYVINDGRGHFVSSEASSELGHFESGSLPSGSIRGPDSCFRGVIKRGKLLVDRRISKGLENELDELKGEKVIFEGASLEVQQIARKDLRVHEQIRSAPLYTLDEGSLIELRSAVNVPSRLGGLLWEVQSYLSKGRVDPLNLSRSLIGLYSALPSIGKLMSDLEEQHLFDDSGLQRLRKFFGPGQDTDDHRYHASVILSRGNASEFLPRDFLKEHAQDFEYFMEALPDIAQQTSFVAHLRDIGVNLSASQNGAKLAGIIARQETNELLTSKEASSVVSRTGRSLNRLSLADKVLTSSRSGKWGDITSANEALDRMDNPLLGPIIKESLDESTRAINEAAEVYRYARDLLESIESSALREDALSMPYPCGNKDEREAAKSGMKEALLNGNQRAVVAQAYLDALEGVRAEIFTPQGNFTELASSYLSSEKADFLRRSYPPKDATGEAYQGRREELRRLVNVAKDVGITITTLDEKMDQQKDRIQKVCSSAASIKLTGLQRMHSHAAILGQWYFSECTVELEASYSSLLDAIGGGEEELFQSAYEESRGLCEDIFNRAKSEWLANGEFDKLKSSAIEYWSREVSPMEMLSFDAQDAPDLESVHANALKEQDSRLRMIFAANHYITGVLSNVCAHTLTGESARLEVFADNLLRRAGYTIEKKV